MMYANCAFFDCWRAPDTMIDESVLDSDVFQHLASEEVWPCVLPEGAITIQKGGAEITWSGEGGVARCIIAKR